MLLWTRPPPPAAVAAPTPAADRDGAGWVAPQCAPSAAPIKTQDHRGTSGDYPIRSRRNAHCSFPIRAVRFRHGCAGWVGADSRRAPRRWSGWTAGADADELRVPVAPQGLRIAA